MIFCVVESEFSNRTLTNLKIADLDIRTKNNTVQHIFFLLIFQELHKFVCPSLTCILTRITFFVFHISFKITAIELYFQECSSSMNVFVLHSLLFSLTVQLLFALIILNDCYRTFFVLQKCSTLNISFCLMGFQFYILANQVNALNNGYIL